MKSIFSLAAGILLSGTMFISCTGKNNNEKASLPILGQKRVETKVVNGEQVLDTVYHTVADFAFVNQDSALVTNATFKDKIYVADFFFSTCPTICPVMKTQMLRVYDAHKDKSEFAVLSHTIDPEYDTVGLLRDYAQRLGIEDASTWHFVTGDKAAIYEIGQNSYMVTAREDDNAEGGYLHSGAFILIDKEGRVRGFYDGTDEVAVNRLIRDIDLLLKEYEPAEEQASL